MNKGMTVNLVVINDMIEGVYEELTLATARIAN